MTNKDKYIAVKEFKDNFQKNMTAETAWKAEKENLALIGERTHKHLIALIAAISIGDKYLILYDWADKGDLRQFWLSRPNPKLNRAMVIETLTQLHGLVDAIRSLHRGLESNSSSRESTGPQSSLNAEPYAVQPSDGLPIFRVSDESDNTNTAPDASASTLAGGWRHGDLKPENILIFGSGDDCELGQLKIADLGLAKQHKVRTEHRRTPTNTKFATVVYEAPEAMTLPAEARSRRYDIWSFGCVMLEFVIWLWYGHSGIEKFLALAPNTVNGTPFYTISSDGTAVVSSRVTEMISKMIREMDEEKTAFKFASPRYGYRALIQVLELIRDKLLVVEPTQPQMLLFNKRRIDADTLVKELSKILHDAREGTQDWDSGHDSAMCFLNNFSDLSLLPSMRAGHLKPVDNALRGGPVGASGRQVGL